MSRREVDCFGGLDSFNLGDSGPFPRNMHLHEGTHEDGYVKFQDLGEVKTAPGLDACPQCSPLALLTEASHPLGRWSAIWVHESSILIAWLTKIINTSSVFMVLRLCDMW